MGDTPRWLAPGISTYAGPGMADAAWRARAGGESTSYSKDMMRQGTEMVDQASVRSSSPVHARQASY